MTWAAVPIGTVIRSSQYGLSLPADPGGHVPIVGMKDIQNGRVHIDPNVCVNLSEEDAQGYLILDGDILLNRTNSPDLVGKAGIYRGAGKAVFASYLVRLELDRDRVDPDYVIQILAGEVGQHRIKQLSTRAVSQANLNPTTFKNHFYIPLPRLSEQVGIRNVLLAWDAAIEKTERLIAAKERTFHWLREGLINSSCNPKLKKYHLTKHHFGEIFAQTKEIAANVDGLEMLSVTRNGIVKQSEYFNKDVASEDKSGYLVVHRGQLALSGLNFWMGAIDFQMICDTGLVSPAYKVFSVVGKGVVDEYLRHYVRSVAMRKTLIRSSVQGASIVRRNLDMDELNASLLMLPDIVVQKEIADLLESAKTELQLYQQELLLMRVQKRGLMQKLLTGQWRVKTQEEVQA